MGDSSRPPVSPPEVEDVPSRTRPRTALLWAAVLSGTIAAAILVVGGVAVSSGPVRFSARNPVPAITAALVLAATAIAWRRRALVDVDLPATWDDLAAAAPVVLVLIAGTLGAIGVARGTFAVGVSDSHCYVAQARLFAEGVVARMEPLAAEAPWPNADLTVAPAGFVAAPPPRGRAVPMCPPGLALAMAPIAATGGGDAVFWVVPLFGVIAVLATAATATHLGGPAAGLMAAAFTAASPVVLFQVVQPMSDVPAMAAWAAAVALVLRGGPAAAGAAGVCTAMAIAVRPNLLPLGAVLFGAVATDPRGRSDRSARLLAFSGPAAVGPLVVAALQWAMHGSPFRSGYGPLGALFSLDHVAPNAFRYVTWFIETHTALPLVALVAACTPVVARRGRAATSGHAWALGVVLFIVASTVACYLPYVVFDDWWYLRFLLPALPMVMALTAYAIVAAAQAVPPAARSALVLAVALLLAGFEAREAVSRRVLAVADLEARFPATGEFVDRQLPAQAVVLTVQHSGSVSFYARRSVVLWDSLDPAWLDDGIAFLESRGRRPFLLIESAEETDFKRRFAGEAFGALDWPPAAQVGPFVRLYDPADRARFHAGQHVATTRVPVPPAGGRARR